MAIDSIDHLSLSLNRKTRLKPSQILFRGALAATALTAAGYITGPHIADRIAELRESGAPLELRKGDPNTMIYVAEQGDSADRIAHRFPVKGHFNGEVSGLLEQAGKRGVMPQEQFIVPTPEYKVPTDDR